MGRVILTLKPERSIVPIVRSRGEVPVSQFLGTGFFVGTPECLHVVSAGHVFTGNPLAEDERYVIAFPEETGMRFREISKVNGSPDLDIAVFDGSGFPNAVPLALASDDAALNADLLMYEYSSTRIERPNPRDTRVTFEPNLHKGHAMRYFLSEFPEKRPTPSFITSFPALRGASGAPVLEGAPVWKEFAVTGMMVANLERHLLPAQIERVDDGGSRSEEVRYFLPVGKALARSLIVQALTDLGVPFRFAARADAAA
jgi:hypothetical protein